MFLLGSDSNGLPQPVEVVSPCRSKQGMSPPNQPNHMGLGNAAPTLTGNDNPQQLHLVSCCCPKVQPQPLLNLDLTPRLVFHF